MLQCCYICILPRFSPSQKQITPSVITTETELTEPYGERKTIFRSSLLIGYRDGITETELTEPYGDSVGGGMGDGERGDGVGCTLVFLW